MLKQYKDEQPVVYRILTNAIQNGKYSHAYLFETNGYYNSIPLVFSFVKMLLCPNKNNENCSDCHICSMIDSGNFPEIKVIKPDGMWIKKEQLLECFKTAMKFLQEFMALKIETPNKQCELIIFTRENYADKMDFYSQYYNEDLECLANRDVKIIDFCCANDLESIQMELWSE